MINFKKYLGRKIHVHTNEKSIVPLIGVIDSYTPAIDTEDETYDEFYLSVQGYDGLIEITENVIESIEILEE